MVSRHEVQRISECADVKTGPFGSALHQADYKATGTPIVTVEHLGERGIIHENLPLVGEEDLKRLSAYKCREGDILFSRVGSVDRNAIVKREEDGWLFSGRLLRVRVDLRKVDPRYLSQVFHTENFKEEVRSVAVGQTMPSLNTQILGGLTVDLPLLDEQKVVAGRLGSADQLIESLERLISKKWAIKQGMVQQLLSGHTRLPGFKNPWREARLGQVGKTYGGLTGKSKQDFMYGNAPFVTFMQVMTRDRLTQDGQGRVTVHPEEQQNSVRKGDILFNGSSETPEEVALAAAVEISPIEETYLNSFCFGFRLNPDAEIDPVYLARYFRSAIGRATVSTLAQGATRYNISKTQLLKVRIELPSLAEQQAISSVISDADDEIEALERRLDSARNIKQGMMQELLTGRTRLVPEGAR